MLDHDTIAGLTGITLSSIVLARWGWTEWRNRHTPTVDHDEKPTRRFTTIDVTVGDNKLTFVTDHPAQPADIQAVHRLMCHAHGPVVAALVASRLTAAIAEHEAADLDAELEQLGGAA